MAGLFVGAMLPFLFSSMAMKAVGLAAMDMITEVRRQFREIEGLKEGKEGVKPDVESCIAISTNASIRQMILPGLLAVITPVVVGFTAGAEALGGLLAGVTAAGVLLAIFMSNAGGAWDNAKKSFEGEGATMKDGEVFKKGSAAHSAAVVGDTVGDPFKDTAGPSLNILVKLMSVVALVIAPLIATNDCCADGEAGTAQAAAVKPCDSAKKDCAQCDKSDCQGCDKAACTKCDKADCKGCDKAACTKCDKADCKGCDKSEAAPAAAPEAAPATAPEAAPAAAPEAAPATH
jgi:K(+)-stimulated pyrophosphate-energized sodium pump